MARQRTDETAQLTRAILLGIAAGAVAMVPMSGTASATTLTEYKAELAAKTGETIIADDAGTHTQKVSLDSSSNVKEVRAINQGFAAVTVADGAVVNGTRFSATDKRQQADGTYVKTNEGGYTAIAVGEADWENPANTKDNPGIVDLTSCVFTVDHGDIVFVNGTSVVQACNLYAGTSQGKYGMIQVGKEEYNPEDPGDGIVTATATLKLSGNTKFNSTWVNDAGETITGHNFIGINKNGILEAESAQIFNRGLGTTGDVADPNGVRDDANNAINFRDGVLLLDDSYYNDAYLNAANTYVKQADNGATVVEMKSGSIKVDGSQDISAVPDDSCFAKVDASKTSVVLSTAANAGKHTSTDSTVNTLNAQSLNLKATTDGSANTITVDGSKLHLGSSTAGQELLTADDSKPATPMALTVENGGSLILGTGAVSNNLDAAVTLTGTNGTTGSSLLINAGQKNIVSITAQSGTTITIAYGATLNADSLIMNQATMQVNGTLSDTPISGGKGTVIRIGSDTGAGHVIIRLADNSSLTGTQIFLDPVWSGGTIADASQFANESTAVDYTLTVGRNSVASLGTSDMTKAEAAFADSQLSWGEDNVTSALYLAAPVTLAAGTGGIKLDGTLTTDSDSSSYAAADQAYFGAGSLLMVDASALSGQAAITAANTTTSVLTVDSAARLYLENVTDGTTYTLASGFADTSAAAGWYTDTDNILVNKLFKISLNADHSATASRQALAAVLPGAVLNHVVDAMTPDMASSLAGVRCLSMATSGLFSDAQATQLINTAAQPAELAGATRSALQASTTFADRAQHHLSFMEDVAAPVVQVQSQPVKAAEGNGTLSDGSGSVKIESEGKSKQDVWVSYGHEKTTVDGSALAGLKTDYNTNFNSITVGYGFASGRTFKSGIAFSYGSGNSTADLERDEYHTTGLSYYGSAQKENRNLLFDVGYYQTKHDVDGLIDVSSKTHIFTTGVTQEYKNEHGNVAIIPHIGLRYSYIDTPAYDGVYAGEKAFRYAPDRKSLFNLSAGVGFMQTIHSHGWKYRLLADLSYIGALGNRENDMDVRAIGLDVQDRIGYEIADRSTFRGELGMNASNEEMEWGVSYSYRNSTNENSHHVGAYVSWKF